MLSDDLKKQIQTAYSSFLSSKSLRPRSAQKQMIAAVARTLGAIAVDDQGKRVSENPVCVVEAGTGTGKTLAYLIAAIPLALAQDKRLVLSTATVALQEQLLYKDLPDLVLNTGLSVRFMLAKGRGRYFCISKAERHLDNQNELGQMALYEDEVEQKLDAETVELYKSLLNEFAAGRWDGDRDALPKAMADEDWQPLTSDHLQCTNRRCANFSSCPFYKAREELDKADVVIANHDLVMADLALGGGAILPEPEESFYIFDEGHHLATKAIGHFSYTLRVKGGLRWLNSANKQLTRMVSETKEHASLADYVGKLALPFDEMGRTLEQIDVYLRQLLLGEDMQPESERYRFPNGRIPDSLKALMSDYRHSAERALNRFEMIVDLLKEAIDGGIPEIDKQTAERWYPRMGLLWARMQGQFLLAESFRRNDQEGSSPTARWINILETLDGLEFECRSSPVSAAATLQEHLWKHCYGAVVASATLTALGRFDRVLADLGLPPDTAATRLASPFRYAEVAQLQVPQMESDPSTPSVHTEEVATYLGNVLPQSKGALVLFSSWKQMLTVLDRLDESIKNRILAQGSYSKNEILRLHREQIDAGEASIIFGLASFAEGVDLPGDYLTEVFITKLPFGVPDDPVEATLAEWIEQQGGNAFYDWVIPMVSMRLTQAVGRLLRTEQDSGRVVLLDRRVVSRRYGRQLLDTLPPFKRKLN